MRNAEQGWHKCESYIHEDHPTHMGIANSKVGALVDKK